MEKREPSCTVGENVNGYSHYGEQYVYSLKNKEYDPTVPPLGMHSGKTTSEGDTGTSIFNTPVFTAAVCTTARKWKQPRSLLYSCDFPEQPSTYESSTSIPNIFILSH